MEVCPRVCAGANLMAGVQDRDRNLFVALPVPGALRALYAKLNHTGLGDAKWHDPEDLHITLRFLGPVDESRIPDIETALSRVRRKTFGVEIDGLDVFEKSNQSILHARVTGTRALLDLSARVGEALTPLAFDFGTRPFTPHITLARVKKADTAAAHHFARHHGRPFRQGWLAETFGLYRSPAPGIGGTYAVLRSFDLSG